MYLLNGVIDNPEFIQEIIKNLSEVFAKKTESGYNLLEEDIIDLEIANQLSVHNHENCVFKQEIS